MKPKSSSNVVGMLVSLAVSLGAVATAFALDAGTPAPSFDLVAADGRHVRLEDLRGKVVVVDFWASWCRPCRESFPTLERFQRTFRSRGLVVVGVSVDQTESAYREFLRGRSVSFTVARDANHAVARSYAPPSMPTTYLIDRRGVVRHVQRGYRRADDARIERLLEQLLAEQP